MVEPGRAHRAAVLAGAIVALATLSVSGAAASASANATADLAVAREGGQDIVVRAAAGIGQVVKADRWAPVLINIDSTLPSFNGELLVSWGDVRVRRALTLPSPGKRRLELYLRTSGPESVIQIRLASGERTFPLLEVPVRVVSSAEPVTLCITSDVSRRTGECVDARSDSLPRSPRGYDVVDQITWPDDGPGNVSEDQRNAMLQRVAIHALDVSGDSGLVQRPSRPERRRGLPNGVVLATGAVASLFVVCFAGVGLWLARQRASARRLWLSATGIVITAAVGAQALGTVGPATSITVHHRTLLEQVPGTDVSVLSMRGVAEFPAHDSFALRLPVTDGTLEPSSSGSQAAEQLLDESGQPVLAGVFGLASRKSFAAEAITRSQPLAISRRGNTWTVTNRSSLTLHQCHFGEGFPTAPVASMPPGRALEAQETGDVFGPAFTCEANDPIVALASSDRTVDMRGTTVIAIYKTRPAIPAAGAP